MFKSRGVIMDCSIRGIMDAGIDIYIQWSLEVKLPTIWIDEKQRREERKEDQRRERVRGKKMQIRKDRNVAIHCVLQIICGSGGSIEFSTITTKTTTAPTTTTA